MKSVTLSLSMQGSADDADVEKVRAACDALKAAGADAGLTASVYFSPAPPEPVSATEALPRRHR